MMAPCRIPPCAGGPEILLTQIPHHDKHLYGTQIFATCTMIAVPHI